MAPDVQLVVGIAIGLILLLVLNVVVQDGDLWLMDLREWLQRRRNKTNG